jgi:Peptidoglycan-binding protein, CsiV
VRRVSPRQPAKLASMHLQTSKLAKVVALAALALVSPAGAQQSGGLTSYDVELIVFRTLAAKATPEEWRMEAGTADQHLAITSDEEASGPAAVVAPPPPPTTPTATFPALPQSKFKLTALADTLKRSRNYQPLAHFGWTQPGFTRGEPRYLSIDGLVPQGSGLSGQIALSRGRYLHLTLELAYDAPEEGGGRMVLRQTRRMRSSERHYIDHPKFGVIAIITPSGGQ